MDQYYTPLYCASCAQLQWRDFRKKPCQFCGALDFAPERPDPTFTTHDGKVLKRYRIPTTTAKEQK